MKLFITDKGDPSVGIREITYQVDVPFDVDINTTEDQEDDLEYFKSCMLNVYKEFSQGKLIAEYNFK